VDGAGSGIGPALKHSDWISTLAKWNWNDKSREGGEVMGWAAHFRH